MNNLEIDKQIEEYRKNVGNYNKPILIIIVILFFILYGIAAFGQISNLEVKNIYIKDKIATPVKIVYSGDTMRVYFSNDSVMVYTDKSWFHFNKPILVNLDTLETVSALRDSINVLLDSIAAVRADISENSNTVKSGPFLKSQGDTTLVPYANSGEKPGNEAFYWGAGYGGLTIDTTIVGQSTNNHGIVGYSINSNGIYGESQNGNGGRFITNSGYNHLLVGDAGDSVAFRLDGTIHQYYNGSQVLYSASSGSLYSLGTKEYSYISGVGAGCTGIQSSTLMDSCNIVLNSNITNNPIFINLGLSGITVKKIDDTYMTSTRIDSSSFDAMQKREGYGTDRYHINFNGIRFMQGVGSDTIIKTDTIGNINANGFVNYKNVYAVGRADSINYTVGGTQNVFYKINTGVLSIKDTSWMFIRGDSIQVRVAGDYEVDVSMAATTSNANDKLRVRLFVNNAVMSPALGRWLINSAGTGNQQSENCPFWYARSLPYGAWLSIRIQNQTAARAVNISDFGFNIKLRHK